MANTAENWSGADEFDQLEIVHDVADTTGPLDEPVTSLWGSSGNMTDNEWLSERELETMRSMATGYRQLATEFQEEANCRGGEEAFALRLTAESYRDEANKIERDLRGMPPLPEGRLASGL